MQNASDNIKKTTYSHEDTIFDGISTKKKKKPKDRTRQTNKELSKNKMHSDKNSIHSFNCISHESRLDGFPYSPSLAKDISSATLKVLMFLPVLNF
jgi:hypothetical protein